MLADLSGECFQEENGQNPPGSEIVVRTPVTPDSILRPQTPQNSEGKPETEKAVLRICGKSFLSVMFGGHFQVTRTDPVPEQKFVFP